MPFVHVITSQLRLHNKPPMLLVLARPRMVRIVMFGNALRSHLRLQLEPPTPLSHRFVNLLGFRLLLLHQQSPSTMPLMMVYSLNGYCPFLPNILQLKQHSPAPARPQHAGAHPTPAQVVPTAPQNVAAAIPPVLPAAPQRAPVASAHVPQEAQRPDGGVPEWCIDTPPQQFICELCFELFTGDHSPVMLGCGNGHTCCRQCEGRLPLEAVNLCPVPECNTALPAAPMDLEMNPVVLQAWRCIRCQHLVEGEIVPQRMKRCPTCREPLHHPSFRNMFAAQSVAAWLAEQRRKFSITVAFVALAAGSVCSFPPPQGQTLPLPADEAVVEGQAQTMRAAAAAAAEARLGFQSTVSESEGGGGSGDPASLSQELNTQQLLAHEPRSEPLPTAHCERIGNRPPTEFVPGQVVHVKFNVGW